VRQVQRLLLQWNDGIAFVQDRNFTIAAATDLAQALHPIFGRGTNIAQHLFLDPEAPHLHPDWSTEARQAVANLLNNTHTNADRLPRATRRLIGELSLKSAPFRTLWAAGDRAVHLTGIVRLDLPLLGHITLDYEQLPIDDSPDSQLLVLHPGTDNATEDALRRLLTTLRADLRGYHRKDQP
jgi:hypothetical protein